jgi:polysaccharide pyruvyl transferase WcaK-like protein
MDHKMNICLLGASFDTSNLGVSALAESSIKCILNHWPNAEVTLLASGTEDGEYRLHMLGREIRVGRLPIRFCKNAFLPNHFCVLLFCALMLKLLPGPRLREAILNWNPYLKKIAETDLVADISGGDSFSDIYGMRKFIMRFLCKWLIIQFDKQLILLPQTYGPFKRHIARIMGRYVLERASVIYTRGHADVEYVRTLLGSHNADGKVRFAPDVAFILDPQRPEHIDVGTLMKVRTKEMIVVGFNINGLLFNGGYTKDNMFGLRINYRNLVFSIVESLMKNEKLLVLLVPHVFGAIGNVESDRDACLQVYQYLNEKYKDRIFLAEGEYNHNEIKYAIGMCDLFIGSRMHTCIAALSQYIPAVGLAYSKKFSGVFESVGMQESVIDMRNTTQDEILTSLEKVFNLREVTAAQLVKIIPEVKTQILNIFEGL